MRLLCRPRTRFSSPRWACALVLFAPLLLGGVASAQEVLPQPDAAATDYRLRIEWTGASAVGTARLSLDRGKLLDARLLEQAVGSIEASGASGVEVRRLRPATQTAIGVTVRDATNAVLNVELPGSSAGGELSFDIPLEELTSGRFNARVTNNDTTVTVTRPEADRLRVRGLEESTIFNPCEELQLEVEAALPEVGPAAPLDITLELIPGRSGEPVWKSAPQRVLAPVTGFAVCRQPVTLPTSEGVYTLRITALRPPGWTQVWRPGGGGKPIAERRVQLVVLDRGPQRSAPSGWRLLGEIDPTTKRWWDRLPKWVWLRRAPWLPEGPLGGGAATIEPHDGRRVVSLAAGAGEPAWQAYPIPVPEPGRPYLVEVEYPADAPQQLILTVMDHGGPGPAGPLGASTAATVSEWGRQPTGLRTVRRLFWPRSRSPLLVLSNGGAESPARFGRIRLLAADDAVAPDAPRPRPTNRQLLAHVASADLPAAFGAKLDGDSTPADWQTRYETALRLADWVALNGQDGAVVTAASPAGTLYPTDALRRYAPSNLTALPGGVVDTSPPDTLELLLQVFDRRGLRLTPTLRFDALGGSLPGKENAQLGAPTPEALLAAARELVERYAGHASFAGVAIDVAEFGGPENADRVADLVQELSDAVTEGDADRRLLVLTHRALIAGASAGVWLPRLDAEPSGDLVLKGVGLDANELERATIVSPRYLLGGGRLVDEAAPIQVNAASLGDGVGVGLFAPERRGQLRSFAAASPFGEAGTRGDLRIVPDAATTAAAYAELAAGALPDIVLEGGDAPLLVLDDRLAAARDAVRRATPRAKPSRVATQQPLTVRAADSDKATTLLFTNPSPWSVDAGVTIRTPGPCRVAGLPGADGVGAGAQFGEGEHALQVSLAPNEVRLIEFNRPGVEPVGIRSRVAPEALEEMRQRLADLRSRNLSAKRSFRSGPSPSFEATDPSGAVTDWEALAMPGGGRVSITGEAVADGDQAVRLTTDGPAVGVQSVAFPAPETGQLAVVFRVRSGRVTGDTQLRIAFEESPNGYRSYSALNDELLGAGQGGWRPFVFAVDDLPLATDSSLRIRFELTGSGRIDIDHLELYDLVFPLDLPGSDAAKHKLALLKKIHKAESTLEAGRLSDCRRMLDGYWPRFLREYTPLIEAPSPVETPSPQLATRSAVADPAAPEENTAEEGGGAEPSLGERLKGYLPSFMR